MQEKNHLKFPSKRGRPKKSQMPAREQARIRKMRQRARLAERNRSKVEILLPAALKILVKKAAGLKSFSEVGEEAFRLWLETKTK